MAVHPILNFHVLSGDKLCICPYNKSHLVLHPRLSRHLVKCRTDYLKNCVKNNKTPEIEICQWNSNHQCVDIRDHELHCPDRECMTEHVLYHSKPGWKLPGPQIPPQLTESSNKVQKKNGKYPMEALCEDWEELTISPREIKSDSEAVDKKNENISLYKPYYDPNHKLLREAIIYTPHGMTKSERRQHREHEHRRWTLLKQRDLVLDIDEENI